MARIEAVAARYVAEKIAENRALIVSASQLMLEYIVAEKVRAGSGPSAIEPFLTPVGANPAYVGDDGEIESQVMSAATALRKKNPTLTLSAACDAALKADPALREKYRMMRR